jgi:hypothetical protein
MTPIRGCWLSFIVVILLCGLALCALSISQPRVSGPGAPLEGVIGGIALLGGLGLLLLSGVLYSLCPNKVIPELQGNQLTADHVRLVTERTKIVFPPAARLVGLCHEDASMSALVATKFELPEQAREDFMQNAIFHTGTGRAPHYELGSHTSWWRRNDLKSRLDRVQYLPGGTYVECSIGLEGEGLVVYVSWA